MEIYAILILHGEKSEPGQDDGRPGRWMTNNETRSGWCLSWHSLPLPTQTPPAATASKIEFLMNFSENFSAVWRAECGVSATPLVTVTWIFRARLIRHTKSDTKASHLSCPVRFPCRFSKCILYANRLLPRQTSNKVECFFPSRLPPPSWTRKTFSIYFNLLFAFFFAL